MASADIDTIALTRLAAKRLKQISVEGLSSEVHTKATHCLVDTLGAIAVGLTGPLAASMRMYATRDIDRPQSYAFAIGKKTSAETAAFTNAVLAHTALRDDMHLESVAHIGSIVIPSALAVAQRDSWNGDQLLKAIVGGYEMGALLGTSLHASGKMNSHFRASGMIGAFAAAGSIACGESSDEATTANALGLAVNAACGVNEWACGGTPEIFIHVGTAARSGITSHALAKVGVVSSPEVLEGKHGLFNALGVLPDAPSTFTKWLQLSSLGRGILDVKWKPAGCCNYTQTTTSLALKISRMPGFAVTDVRSIDITTTTAAIRYPGCDNAGPLHSTLQGMMSIQYGVSVALLLGRLSEASWDPLCNPDTASLMRRCNLSASPAFDEAYRQGLQPARIVITLEDGNVIEQEAADVPWMESSEVLARSVREIGEHVPAERAQQLVELCLDVDQLENCEKLEACLF
ncbi:hypothetical protein M409DRAFT_28070 [Zasmidium cellare ATCC 36951]|uniref:MmgE/PrpD family protein n=1 Tax=Zasmidium cellare ATCC 36951 TaxID=1080233 RepID=A0A6A6C417_ZASCE|nr:uncharacterized protein M409DRAFT_28070 [Zasmidium cellare ATCC 36951]KAF2161673.1 hypothetical protein M409DRAFT_28070 [Zasmidium cellare ATCC 36951]